MTYHAAMTKIPSHWPKGIKTADEVLAAALEDDPEFAVEWERLALARMVAARLAGYRFDHDLSQRAVTVGNLVQARTNHLGISFGIGSYGHSADVANPRFCATNAGIARRNQRRIPELKPPEQGRQSGCRRRRTRPCPKKTSTVLR